jgi:hypothetical protein
MRIAASPVAGIVNTSHRIESPVKFQLIAQGRRQPIQIREKARIVHVAIHQRPHPFTSDRLWQYNFHQSILAAQAVDDVFDTLAESARHDEGTELGSNALIEHSRIGMTENVGYTFNKQRTIPTSPIPLNSRGLPSTITGGIFGTVLVSNAYTALSSTVVSNAKNAATYGDHVKSNSRVGPP